MTRTLLVATGIVFAAFGLVAALAQSPGAAAPTPAAPGTASPARDEKPAAKYAKALDVWRWEPEMASPLYCLARGGNKYGIQLSNTSVPHLEQIIQASEKQLKLAQEENRVGRASRDDVAEAEIQLLDARVQLAEIQGGQAVSRDETLGMCEKIVQFRQERYQSAQAKHNKGIVNLGAVQEAEKRLSEAKTRLAQRRETGDRAALDPGTIHFAILSDSKEVYRWQGHTHTVFHVLDDRLYYARFSFGSSGGTIVAVDLKTGTELWTSPLKALGPVQHSAYQNRLTLTAGSDEVIVQGNESFGRYIEVKSAATGETLAHKVFPKVEPARKTGAE
jgi:hypothetical protein